MKQPLPQNPEMECAALGAMMNSGKAARSLCRMLSVEDFASERRQRVFEAIKNLADAGKPVDVVTVPAELKRIGTLNEAGGSVEVMTLVQRSPAVAAHKAYGEAVREAAIRRAVVKAGEAVQEAGYECENPDELINRVESAAHTARSRLAGSAIEAGGVWLADMVDEWDYLSGEDTDIAPFPMSALNVIAGGQRKGQVVVTGGYSADGKSWFGLDCAEAAALAGCRTLICSIEMPAEEVFARLTAMGGHDFDSVLRRRASPAEINDRVGELRRLPIKVMDASSGVTSAKRLRLELQRARVNGAPYRYVLVDHLHLMEHAASRDGYRIGLNNTLSELKRMAQEFGVTMHILAQLRRSSTTSEHKFPVPTMADFRESGGVENIADYALMVWRERNGLRLSNTGLIVTAKVRSGKNIGSVPVEFDEHKYRFRVAHTTAAPYARSIA